MSQAGVLNTVSNAPLPPTIPTSFQTDKTPPAIPSGNVLQVKGATSTDNNANGIETIANPSMSNLLQVALTNRAVGAVTTTDGSTVNLIVLSLGTTPGIYAVYGSVTGFVPAGNIGGGYFFEGVVRTNGITATFLGGQFSSFQEDTAFQSAFVFLGTSGNNLIVEVTGIAATIIDWNGVLNFTFSS